MKMQQLPLPQAGRLLQNKGQSVIEIFLALIVFSMALLGLVILVNNYLKVLKTSKDLIIANFLAQEGIELVIAKRNINKVQRRNWLEGLPNKFCIDSSLYIQPANNACPLYIYNNQFLHSVINGPPTPFSRLINLDISLNVATVTSIVKFNGQQVELETIITDWIP